MNYIVKETNNKTGKVKYHLSGHSILNEGATRVSKYYTYDSERGAKSLMTRIKKSSDSDSSFEVVTAQSQGMEVY